jgi:hypothetical protein
MFPAEEPQRSGGTRLTAFDISRLVNDTSSGTASTNINTNIVIHVRVQVIVRAIHCQFNRTCKEGEGRTHSIDACLEGFRKFCRKGSDCAILYDCVTMVPFFLGAPGQLESSDSLNWCGALKNSLDPSVEAYEARIGGRGMSQTGGQEEG